ncbi:unnamed protein product [Ilex paraguariensis]|uniref:PB1-like domain-containing protein n=1 Tax=Ilex paraguariensis TaxID=185542 RepID=A0ABC8R9P4_9AQUA
MVRSIRKEKGNQVGSSDVPYYGHDSSLFSMEVHHSGQFTESPTKAYVGGKINYIDDCDCELMSLIEMDDIANSLGYAPYIGFYYKLPSWIWTKG